MTDLLNCVNSGVLPNGLNDLYNSDMRNAIMNGMNLCAPQVDACIANAKKNCKNIYHAASDVWIDFNSRVIQPNYYSFVLRKTGLTPNQAENTCWLLDKNTFGTSFSAVDNQGGVTNEYNNTVNAYNELGTTKNLPQGAEVNVGNPGVDGSRGHYARWDATTGECLVRVAAYNGNNMITNKWLFGALGDDKAAEAWKPAGSSFICGKSLFEFNLLNKTSTAAVVGIGGGTVVGATTGAIIGHNKGKIFSCKDNGDLKELREEIWRAGLEGGLSIYMNNPITSDQQKLTLSQCQDIVKLRDIVSKAKNDPCYNAPSRAQNSGSSGQTYAAGRKITLSAKPAEPVRGIAADKFKEEGGKWVYTMTDSDVKTVNNTNQSSSSDNSCNGRWQELIKGNSLRCNTCEEGQECCTNTTDFRRAVTGLENMLNQLESLNGHESKTLQGALIGGATGAGVGGLVTGITYFVERNQISCRIGDGLDRVMYNKTGKIDSLKDYYVKWNLKLPDTIMPTAQVVDCASWRNACATIRDIPQCVAAQINFKPHGAKTVKLIDSACTTSGSICIENLPVAVSNGACDDGGGHGGGH
jgi:hypothetical protein